MPRYIGQIFADAVFEVHVENCARCLIRRAYAKIGIDCDNTGRQTSKYDLEVRAFGFDERLAETRFPPGRSQTLGHVIKGVDQKPDLVARRRGQACVEVTCGNRPCTGDKVLDGGDESPGQYQCAVNGCE